MIDFIREIETNYPVDQITFQGNQIWPYLRARYFFRYREIGLLNAGQHNHYKLTFGQMVKMIPDLFWGYSNWWRKYDNAVLTASNCRRPVNGKYFNIFLDQVIDEIGRDKSLTIETPVFTHYPIDQIYNRNAVSTDAIYLLSFAARDIVKIPIHISGESILKEIEAKYKLGIPYKRLVRQFNYTHHLYKLIFRRLRVKNLFVTCYYDKEAAIKAAHDLGVRVIEIQHGTIGPSVPAYNIFRKMDKVYFPDYLFTYGEKDLEIFSDGRFINPANVHVVGSFYIEYMKEHSKPIEDYAELKKHYKTLVGVSLEMVAEERVIDFVSKAANLDRTICYIIVPRRLNNYLFKMNLPENVIVSTKNNFYQTMMYVDFQSAIYSTCAIEAPSLGVQNILINIDNLSKHFYSDVLNDTRVTRFVDTPEDYVKEINSFSKLEKETIIQLNKRNISPGYKENVRDALRALGF